MPLITDAIELQTFCDHAITKPFLAMDTEFVRGKTYHPTLCLVQIATDEMAVMIDMLTPDLDFTPLKQLLLHPDIVKVFHAGRQDIEMFYRFFGITPSPVFDTQVAAMVCGLGIEMSYGAITKHVCNVELNKAMQYTD